MTEYLFSLNPGKLYLQNYIVPFVIVLLVLTIAGFWLLKKRRNYIKLERDKRLLVHKAFKINLILSIVLALLIGARILEISLVSMRFLGYGVSVAIILVFVFFGFKAIRIQKSETIETINTNEYSKYLPHKKKK